MNEYEAESLEKFFSSSQPFEYNGDKRYSTLDAALRECRHFTKRDNSGNFNADAPYGYPGHWLGAIGYFTILDQLGSCYSIDGITATGTNSIRKAIEFFGYDLLNHDDRQLHALIALRNAFTHDFNLLNIPHRSNLIQLQQHKFTVYAEPKDSTVVQLPAVHWNGDIIGKDFHKKEDSTFVNIFAFGSLVEMILYRIKEHLKNRTLVLSLSVEELINKYTFITSEHVLKLPSK